MATTGLHFDKAPIREAIIEIQIHDLPDSTVGELSAIAEQVQNAYPQKLDLRQAEFVGQMGPEGPTASAQQKIIGLQFQSADSRQIFQARINGFSFHRLAPYERWPSFRDEAFRLWRLYREVVGPVELLNFSVRYINEFIVPASGQLEDHFLIYPQIPPGIPQVLSSYLMRLELPLQNEGSGEGMLTMTQALPRSETGAETATILLDNQFSYSASGVSDDEVWIRIDAVQAVKNRIFLASLTPAMQGRIS